MCMNDDIQFEKKGVPTTGSNPGGEDDRPVIE